MAPIAPGENGIGAEAPPTLADVGRRSVGTAVKGTRKYSGTVTISRRSSRSSVPDAELADVQVVLLVGVGDRLVVAVDDRGVARDRRQPGDDVEVGHALGLPGQLA